MAKSFGKHFTALKASIDALPEKININAAVAAQSNILNKALARIDAAMTKLASTPLQADVDTSALEGEVRTTVALLRALKVPETEKIEGLLNALYLCVEKGDKAEINSLKEGIAKVEAAVKALKLPTTFSINQQQMRALTGSMSSMPTFPGVMAARSAITTNVTLTSASTEYSYTFPANTTKWQLKLRDQGVLGYYAFTTGKMPSGGDSSNYVTIPQNFVQSPDGMDWSGKTIYLGAESASQIAELTVFTA